MPFGGCKDSGTGREGTREGVARRFFVVNNLLTWEIFFIFFFKNRYGVSFIVLSNNWQPSFPDTLSRLSQKRRPAASRSNKKKTLSTPLHLPIFHISLVVWLYAEGGHNPPPPNLLSVCVCVCFERERGKQRC